LFFQNASQNQFLILSALLRANNHHKVPHIHPRLHFHFVVKILYIAKAHKANSPILPNFDQASFFFVSFSSIIHILVKASENISHHFSNTHFFLLHISG
jgi:hypothetical protein